MPVTSMPDPSSSRERRRHQRIPQDLRTKLTAGPPEVEAPAHIRITDLSAGGAGFLCTSQIPKSSTVEFTVPLAVPVKVRMKVLRCEPDGEGMFLCGGQFYDLGRREIEVLRGYIHLQITALGLKPLEED